MKITTETIYSTIYRARQGSGPNKDIASKYGQIAIKFNMSHLESMKMAKRNPKRRKAKIHKVSVFELLTIMAVMAYSNYYNKIRFIFNLFDFDGNHSIDLDEIAVMVVWFLEGWGKIIGVKMPQRRYIETFAEIIYLAAEFVPNGKITIKGIGDWVENNKQMMQMLQTYEPDSKINDDNSIFLPLPRLESADIQTVIKNGSNNGYQVKNSMLKSETYSNYSSLTKKNMGKIDINDFTEATIFREDEHFLRPRQTLKGRMSMMNQMKNPKNRRASSMKTLTRFDTTKKFSSRNIQSQASLVKPFSFK